MILTTRGAARARLPLRDATLHHHAHRVTVPNYDRRALVPSVVHLGVGGFHRAHQGVYFDDLARLGVTTECGVIGVSLRRREMSAALAPQDYLYTVVSRGSTGERARVVGALRGSLFAPLEQQAVHRALADRRTRLVTLTITGDGYHLDPETGALDLADEEVRADLGRPDAPTTALGHIVKALAQRRRAGLPPFTVLSCDNIADNGMATRAAVVGFASVRDEVLGRWIENNVAFPGSMVDRITPTTTRADRDRIGRRYGIGDTRPVVTEPFKQWVVEDSFCDGRPRLEEVGVQFVRDVTPYRIAKTRLLNASHSALGYLGTLAGYRRTDEAMADPVLREYMARLMSDEIGPLLPAVPGLDLTDYQGTLLERVSNPAIADPLARLCGRGSTKVPAYVLPSLREAVATGRPHELLALAVAAWMRYLRGTDLRRGSIEIHDVRRDQLQALARAGGDDPRPLLADERVFGSLGRDPHVAKALERALQDIARHGIQGAVRSRTAPELRLAA